MKDWETIADKLSKAGWSLGWVSAIDSSGHTIWIAEGHRDDGQRVVVHADEKLMAFLELERVTRESCASQMSNASPRIRFAVASWCYFSTPHRCGSENMGAFTLIGVAPRESVAFSFKISNLSLKSFALLFSVF